MTEIQNLMDAISTTGLTPPEPHQLEAAINKDKPVRWSIRSYTTWGIGAMCL